jgi:hypothetical protein
VHPQDVLQLLLVWAKLAGFRSALARQAAGAAELFSALGCYLPSSVAADGEAADQRAAADTCMAVACDLVSSSRVRGAAPPWRPWP